MNPNELEAELRALAARQQHPGLTSNDPPHPFFGEVEELDDYLLEETEMAGDIEPKPKAMAAYRAKRTGYQGLIAAVLIAVGCSPRSKSASRSTGSWSAYRSARRF